MTDRPPQPEGSRTESPFLRLVLVSAGLLATFLAVAGIFLPLLPTVPLLLLAAACFARSSERCHRWLVEHRRLGPVIRAYREEKAVPLRAKVVSILLIWTTIPASAFLWVDSLPLRFLLLLIGFAVTVYLLRLPTSR